MSEVNVAGGLAGGILIGIAATLLLAGPGRIAGISGIVAGVISNTNMKERTWRGLFIAGLISGAAIYRAVTGELPVQMQASGWPLLISGLLVGFGTNLGSGCTSGHGICGIARFSIRSICATTVFMSAAILTVYITRHVLV